MTSRTYARQLVPQSIRDRLSIESKLDNVFFAPKELDAKLFEIYREIQNASGSSTDDNASGSSIDDNIVIDNVLLHSDAYLYALKTLIRGSRRYIRIFTRHLDQRMLDGTPLYSDPDIVDAIRSFLENPGARLDILFREEPKYEAFSEHLLIRSIGASQGLNLFCATSESIRHSHSRFITFDGVGYNLRYRNYAIINFNNPDYTENLIGIFDRMKELSTTFRLVPGASADDWGNLERSFG